MTEAEFYARLAQESPKLLMALVPVLSALSVVAFVLGFVTVIIFGVGQVVGDWLLQRWREYLGLRRLP